MSITERFLAKFTIGDKNECWNWKAALDKRGYGAFTYNESRRCAHRYSYEFYKEEIPDGLCVCHTCDNPSCVNPNHLFLGTQKDNLQDMTQKGRRTCGEDSHYAKLTENDVRQIRKLYATGKYTREQLSIMYDVSKGQIRRIVLYKLWKHIK